MVDYEWEWPAAVDERTLDRTLKEISRALSGDGSVRLTHHHLKTLVSFFGIPAFILREHAVRNQDRDLAEAVTIITSNYSRSLPVLPRHLLAIIRCAHQIAERLKYSPPWWAIEPVYHGEPPRRPPKVQREEIGPVTVEEILAWIWIMQSMLEEDES